METTAHAVITAAVNPRPQRNAKGTDHDETTLMYYNQNYQQLSFLQIHEMILYIFIFITRFLPLCVRFPKCSIVRYDY